MGISKNYHVASGSFEVGNTQSRLLQAFLGTCVGVAVFDGTAGVGGLIHLLLPEPINPDQVDHPAKYATTGMPLFLNQLMDMSATRENMRAVVAGGALVGPLSPQDMNLNIGGRTAEKVYTALHTQGIAVERSETGGFFTCSIELDMASWTCEIRPAGFDVSFHEPGSIEPVTGDIHQAIETIRPVPQVALKVLRIISEGTSTMWSLWIMPWCFWAKTCSSSWSSPQPCKVTTTRVATVTAYARGDCTTTPSARP
ncbi:MAG: chemotaxis protein CheD [Desulfosarcina sp.]|nr:chemotaxis protein CheD [Desulfosarcina sp.]